MRDREGAVLEGGLAEAPASGRSAARPWWAIGAGHVVLLTLASLFFLQLSITPLGSGALWGHVSFGEWILTERALPAEDPFQPLARGMPVVDGEWLAEVALALAQAAGGSRGLSILFALLATGLALALGRAIHERTGSFLWTLAGLAVGLALALPGWAALDPALFGLLCFALLLLLLAREERAPGRAIWAALPVLLVLWTSLHDSFVIGLAALLAWVLGRTIEAVIAHRGLRGLIRDREVGRRLVLLELGVAATLLNPYGMDRLAHALWLPGNPALSTLRDHQPLAMTGGGGRLFLVSLLLLAVAARWSDRRLLPAHALLVALLLWLAAGQSRHVPWYGLAFALAVTPHLAAAARRLRRRGAEAREGRRAKLVPALRRLAQPSWHYTLLAVVIVWGGFALSSLGGALLGRPAPDPTRTFGAAAPSGVAAHLREAPPTGLVFAPQAWTDWLGHATSPALQAFATSRIEHLPRQVWADYLRVAGGGAEWPRVLERYRVETVIMDQQAQRAQLRDLRYSPAWRMTYEDAQAAVFVRTPSEATPPVDELQGEHREEPLGEPEGELP